jgi:hypothetical protein
MQSPKSKNTIFCIRLDDRELGMSFASADEAEVAAHGLFQYGYKKIEIVDLFSGLVVRHVTTLTGDAGNRRQASQLNKEKAPPKRG